MDFDKLAEKVGLTLAVLIAAKNNELTDKIFNSLTFEELNDVLNHEELHDRELKDRILKRQKKLAKFYSHFIFLHFNSLIGSKLEKFALRKLKKFNGADSFIRYLHFFVDPDNENFGASAYKLVKMATTFEEWEYLRGRFTNAQDIRYALGKMAKTADTFAARLTVFAYAKRGSKIEKTMLEKLNGQHRKAFADWKKQNERMVQGEKNILVFCKLGRYENQFKKWECIFDLAKNMNYSVLRKVAVSMMLKTAKTIEDRLFIHNEAELYSADQASAICRLVKTPEACLEILNGTDEKSVLHGIAFSKLCELAKTQK